MEGAVAQRGIVLLNIARVEVVKYVVYTQPSPELDAVPAKLEIDWVLEFGVQGYEGWETSCLVLGADKIPILIES